MNKLVKQQNLVGITTLPNTTKKELTIYNAHTSAKRLKDFDTKEDLLLINSLLTRWSKYVGAKVPEAVDLNILANFIKKNFSNLNAYDLKECIELITLKELNTDAKPYGELSAIYISEVLKAYQEHKMEVVFKVREKVQKIQQTEVKPISIEERIANFKKLLTIAKEEQTKGLFYKDTGDTIYNFIKHNKLIELSKKLIAEAMAFGTKEYQRLKKEKALQIVIKNNRFEKIQELNFQKEDVIKKNAREFVVNRFLNQVELKDLLQKINAESLKY